ncbi:hypothetical protein K435DRAFT_839509 [Dendrothele bispora CBS 962.96]|uniref:L domain-like protein n=1 Tax=Dendrothele bispora (strain CBS 962.96) TaxID=1314807 RepID=A0A4S8M0E7_DENBC|nr:hypothetical protein K435DRAFT_839509 [Dendrothele bispora CBS 962.96]
MPDPHEQGDSYVRRIAAFIRTNERNLAEVPFIRRTRRPQQRNDASILNPLSWLGPTQPPPAKPIVLSIDTHHLFYLFIRLEALGLPIGSLDVRVDNPSRPLSYINLFPDSDKSDTLSLSSIRSSLSAVSSLSLGAGWWGRSEQPSVDSELKYIYSCFTKLPALSITAPGPKLIAELANEPPNANAAPLDSFKNLQSLECIDIDPRSLLGWDRLATSLISLKIRKSGLEDVTEVFIGAVLDDQARREGSVSRKRVRRIPKGPARQTSFYATQLPESVPEAADEDQQTPTEMTSQSPLPHPELAPDKWASLKHLSLSDNSLTFFPTELIPHLKSVTHLDLSSNLLVSVPQGLGELYNLISLNLSDNMIDSVLGIYMNLGQILQLNLSRNRLESICGLERLHALERIDLRGNLIEESAEIGRLATLPNISEVWIEGNPFVEYEENYRVTCFDFFWKEGKSVNLDGTPPGFSEKRHLTQAPPQQMTSSRPISVAYSPPTIAVGHSHRHTPPVSTSAEENQVTSSDNSPSLAPIGALGVGVGGRSRKKAKRIVDLDGSEQSDDISNKVPRGHRRQMSDGSSKAKMKKKEVPANSLVQAATILAEPLRSEPEAVPESTSTATASELKPHTPSLASNGVRRSRHSRYHTEYAPSSVDDTPTPLPSDAQSSVSRRRDTQTQTLSGRTASHRARLTSSVYDPPIDVLGGVGASSEQQDGEAFRRKIEALKKDMGDGWLKVFSQTQMPKTPS